MGNSALLLREKDPAESTREKDEGSEGGGEGKGGRSGLGAPRGGSSPGGTWPGTIKSSWG